jgi:hypothetical protein
MPWFKNVCIEVFYGGTLGVLKGAFGISLFTESETEELNSLKQLALSVMRKAPEITTDPIICEGIRNGRKSALESFTNGLSPEAVAVGVGTAAELVCNKSFKQRFASVLMGACLNIVNC